MSVKKIKTMKPALLEDFKECCNLKLKIKLLNQANGTQVLTNIIGLSDTGFILSLPKDYFDAASFIKGTILGTVFHHDKILGITFKINSINNMIHCDLPVDLFEIDSRQDERMLVDSASIATLKVSFTINNEFHMHPVSCPIYDLSPQGFSILALPEHAQLFKPGESFKIVNLKILGTQITFSAESKNMYFIPEKKGVLKVGFKIIKMQTTHELLLNKYLERKKDAKIAS